MASVKLGTKAVGSIVKLKVSGTAREFIVVHQGKPSSIYDASCDGTWLLMKDAYEVKNWHNTNVAKYASSDIHNYLNSTFYNLFDAKIKTAIKQIKIPYCKVGSVVAGGADGLPTRIFLLSGSEVGFEKSNVVPLEGAKLSYFLTGRGTDAASKRICYLGGVAKYWWLRSPSMFEAGDAVVVSPSGNSHYNYCNGGSCSRPALILPPTLTVSDDGTVYTNLPPTAPTSIALPATVKGGQSFAISWAGASDPDGNLQGYYLERSINGGTTWVQVYQGSAAHTTDILQYGVASTVQYRVRAYDQAGETSAWYTCASKAVVNNTAPAAPGTITVPLQVVGGKTLTLSWSSSSDKEGNTAGYKLERKIGSAVWAQIYAGAKLSYTDAITKGWVSVTYRVKAYDSYNEESAYTTSPARTVDNNTAPTVTSQSSGDLGVKSAGFAISYTVNDVDGDSVTVIEKMDGVQKRSFAVTLGASNSFAVTSDYFMKLLNGTHTMTITATDAAGKAATLTLTFTKAVYACRITMDTPFAADALITKTVVNVVRSIPSDAEFKVLLTNNANDPEPVWEDATAIITTGLNYLFENTTAVNGNAYNFILTASRSVSGQGGFISSIGGAFE